MDGDWICNFLSPCQELPLGCAWPKFFFSLAISALSGPPTSLPFFPENYLQNWFPLLQTNIMGTWGGKKNLGLWWIRAVRCFQVSFVFVLLPVRFFVFPATGNCAPAHAVPMVHGYHHRICPSPDVSSLCYPCSPSLWCKQPLLTDCPCPSHHDASDLLVETLLVPHGQWPGSYSHSTGPLICLIFFTLLLPFSFALFSWFLMEVYQPSLFW